MLFNACLPNSNPKDPNLGAGPGNPKVTRFAVLLLNRGFRRNTASPRCVSLVGRPLTINPTQQACHLNHFIVLDLDVAKQTSILRHYSVGNRGREISDHIVQVFFGRTKNIAKIFEGQSSHVQT